MPYSSQETSNNYYDILKGKNGNFDAIARLPKRVMEAAPVLIENRLGGARKPWDVFEEATKKSACVWFEQDGHKMVGMVPAEIRSRKGDHNKSMSTTIQEAIIMGANLHAYDTAKLSGRTNDLQNPGISEQDLLFQYQDQKILPQEP